MTIAAGNTLIPLQITLYFGHYQGMVRADVAMVRIHSQHFQVRALP